MMIPHNYDLTLALYPELSNGKSLYCPIIASTGQTATPRLRENRRLRVNRMTLVNLSCCVADEVW